MSDKSKAAKLWTRLKNWWGSLSPWQRILFIAGVGMLIGMIAVGITLGIASHGIGVPGIIGFGYLGAYHFALTFAGAAAAEAVASSFTACVVFLCGFSIGATGLGAALGAIFGSISECIRSCGNSGGVTFDNNSSNPMNRLYGSIKPTGDNVSENIVVVDAKLREKAEKGIGKFVDKVVEKTDNLNRRYSNR